MCDRTQWTTEKERRLEVHLAHLYLPGIQFSAWYILGMQQVFVE